MKTILPLLLSLGLNLALAGLYIAGERSAAEPAHHAPAPGATSVPTPKIDATIWPALESAELPTLIDRLRASGFPPSLVRAIIAAQISERFAAQRKALRGDLGSRPFWKDGGAIDPKIYAAERELDRQQRKLMRELFGDQADADDAQRNLYNNRAFTFLPAEKADEVRRILRDYDERRSDLFAASPIYDREKMQALDKEQRATIARVLSPAELFEYDLRTSNTGNRLRDELSAFNPTEAEFRTIYQMRQAFDERYGEIYGLLSADESRQRFEAEKTLREQIKGALDPVRAGEYDRAIDFNYRRATQLLARLELPRQNADLLWDVQKDVEQRRNDLMRNRTAAPGTGDPQFVALQNDALARIAPLIGGAKNLDVYKQYGGQWLEYLVPRARPATPPAPATPVTPVTPAR